jgi:transposase-like protein
VKRSNEFIWFKEWLCEGYTVSQLSRISKKSERKIRLIIDYWLSKPPRRSDDHLARTKYLVFDGSFIWKRKTSAVILLDAETNKLVYGLYDFKENSFRALLDLFQRLKVAGVSPRSCTVDGLPAVIKALAYVWPDIIIQRCLFHIQRQGLKWCRSYPKTTEAKQLRLLFLSMMNISTFEARDNFLLSVKEWEGNYGSKIKDRPERGRVFSDLKRARSMLLNALPNAFHYLHDVKIAKTTNLAEGYFSFMKTRYRDHRGLSSLKRKAFFNWFFYLKK